MTVVIISHGYYKLLTFVTNDGKRFEHRVTTATAKPKIGRTHHKSFSCVDLISFQSCKTFKFQL